MADVDIRDAITFKATTKQKERLDQIKDELGISIQDQLEHGLGMWFEKAEELLKTMKK